MGIPQEPRIRHEGGLIDAKPSHEVIQTPSSCHKEVYVAVARKLTLLGLDLGFRKNDVECGVEIGLDQRQYLGVTAGRVCDPRPLLRTLKDVPPAIPVRLLKEAT